MKQNTKLRFDIMLVGDSSIKALEKARQQNGRTQSTSSQSIHSYEANLKSRFYDGI